jgi:aquaporin Z
VSADAPHAHTGLLRSRSEATLEDFLDRRLEWRRLFSEAWGTFLLVLVAAGGGVVAALPAGSGLDLPALVLAPGIMVMAIIYFMGSVSGAHLNPAVTWAFAIRGNFPWRRVPGYLVAQAVGAFAAAGLLDVLLGGIENGATVPGKDITTTQAVIVEALVTLGLVSVILGTASGARNIGMNAALAVGGYIGLVVVWAAPLSGASMNPIRSLAPAALGGSMDTYWVYLVGPLVGASVAVLFEWILRGPATQSGRDAAAGLLSPENPTGR